MTHYYKMQLIPKFVFEDRMGMKPPIIEINSNDQSPTYIGRNTKTQIKTVAVSRQLCTVEVCKRGAMSIIMRKSPNLHQVDLDGIRIATPIGVRTPIYSGSTLSLFESRYSYEVKISDVMGRGDLPNPQCPPHAATAVTENDDSDSIDEAEADNITNSIKSTVKDELMCSICMDVIWKASVVSPCGHLYCQMCIEDSRKCGDGKCPKCRGEINEIVPVPSTDTIIFCMMRAGEFERDDTNHFLKRSGKRLSKVEEKLMNVYYNNKRVPNIEDAPNGQQNKKCHLKSETHLPNKRPRLKGQEVSPSDDIHINELLVSSGTTEEDAIAID